MLKCIADAGVHLGACRPLTFACARHASRCMAVGALACGTHHAAHMFNRRVPCVKQTCRALGPVAALAPRAALAQNCCHPWQLSRAAATKTSSARASVGYGPPRALHSPHCTPSDPVNSSSPVIGLAKTRNLLRALLQRGTGLPPKTLRAALHMHLSAAGPRPCSKKQAAVAMTSHITGTLCSGPAPGGPGEAIRP